jgi:hypothetical protein
MAVYPLRKLLLPYLHKIQYILVSLAPRKVKLGNHRDVLSFGVKRVI